ncbi:MAG: photosynthetic reaction center subunit H [Reyranella sp.]
MITGIEEKGIDLAMLCLWAFTIFFVGLIFYLQRESKREGYPLIESAGDRPRRASIIGWPAPPPPKTYHLNGGETVTVADGRPDLRPIAAKPMAKFPGAPLIPTGDPLADGVGPAAYAERADVPDKLFSGEPRILPLRAAPAFHIADRDPDPRGMAVIAGDRENVGTIVDVWIDRAEYVIRYLEAEIPGAGVPRRVMIPMGFARVNGRRRRVEISAIFGKHFPGIPAIQNPDRITLLEEDRIMGYFGGGTLYASPQRAEPLV